MVIVDSVVIVVLRFGVVVDGVVRKVSEVEEGDD